MLLFLFCLDLEYFGTAKLIGGGGAFKRETSIENNKVWK